MKKTYALRTIVFALQIFLNDVNGYCQYGLRDMQVPANTFGGVAGSADVNPMYPSEIMVLSAHGGLYRSVTNGTTWERVNGCPILLGGMVKFCPSNPDIIIATCGYDSKTDRSLGIWRSTDHGRTWNHPDPLPYATGSRCPDRCGASGISWVADKVFVATDCGLVRSDNNGQDWVAVPVDPTSTGGDDIWDRWRARPDRLWAVDAMDATHIEVGGESGAYWTHDGTTWTRCAGPACFYSPGEFSHVPQAPNLMFRADFNTAYLNYSTDQGITWNPFPVSGLEAGNQSPFTKVTSSSRGAGFFELYFGTGVYLKRATLSIDPSTWNTAVFENLRLDHTDPLSLAFNSSTGRPYILVGDWGISKTGDDGASWHSLGNGRNGYNALEIFGLSVQRIGNAYSNADISFITWHNGSWVSTNNGRSWEERWPVEGKTITFNGPELELAEDAGTAVWPWGGNPVELGRTLNGLSPRWVPPMNIELQRSINFFRDPTTLQNFSLIGTWDGDNNMMHFHKRVIPSGIWTEVASEPGNPIWCNTVRFATTGSRVNGYYCLWGNGGDRILLRKIVNLNGATTLESVPCNGLGGIAVCSSQSNKLVFDVKPDNDQILIAADGVSMQMVKSTDGGRNWIPMNALTRLITDDGQYMFKIGNQHFQVTEIVFNPMDPEQVAVGTFQNGFFLSYDSGDTWTRIPGSESITKISEIRFGWNNTIYIGSMGRGLWKYTLPFLLSLPDEIYLQCPPCIIDPNSRKLLPWEIIHPGKCLACQYVISKKGSILNYEMDKERNIMQIYATDPSSVYIYSGKEGTMEFEILEGTKQMIKQAKPLRSLVFNDGKLVAQVEADDQEWVIKDNIIQNARIGIPESKILYEAPVVPEPENSFNKLPVSKAVLSIDKKYGSFVPVIMQGEKFTLVGSGFGPINQDKTKSIRLYADGLLLPGEIFPDQKGNFSMEEILPLPPGNFTLTAVYFSKNGPEKSELKIMIRSHDGDKDKKFADQEKK